MVEAQSVEAQSMIETYTENSHWELSPEPVTVIAAVAAREARERALAAGQTVTTHKDGKLVQEKMVAGKLVEVFSQTRERDSD